MAHHTAQIYISATVVCKNHFNRVHVRITYSDNNDNNIIYNRYDMREESFKTAKFILL